MFVLSQDKKFELMLTGRENLSCTVTELRVNGQKSQILPTPFYLAPSFEVTPFEFIKKFYGF